MIETPEIFDDRAQWEFPGYCFDDCVDATAGRSYHSTMKTDSDKTLTDADRVGEKERTRRKREALVVKDWRKAGTKLEDTPLAREAWAKGEEYRRSQTTP